MKKHGHANRAKGVHRTYSIWCGMFARCYNPNVKSFKNYGARGITVCLRWKNYSNFLSDMGEAPPNLSIDRIDNSKNYYRKNCRWATQSEQCLNQRRSRKYTYFGETKNLTTWAILYKVDVTTLHLRLKRGIPIEKALTMKRYEGRKGKPAKQYIFKGHAKGLSEWAKEFGLTRNILEKRLKSNWTFQDAIEIPPTERKPSRQCMFKGRTKSLTEWAKEFGISRRLLRRRLQSNWSFQDAIEIPLGATYINDIRIVL